MRHMTAAAIESLSAIWHSHGCDSPGDIHFPGGPGNWQLSECLHLADSERSIDRIAVVALPQLQNPNKALRQCSRFELANARWQMPQVQKPNFLDVPNRGASDGVAVFSVLSRVWTECRRIDGLCAIGEMDGLRSLDGGPDGHGHSRAHPARQSKFPRARVRSGLQYFHAAFRRNGCLAFAKTFRLPSA